MSTIMEQMGIDLEEMDVSAVEVELDDGTVLEFGEDTEVNKIDAQGEEMYQIVGSPDTETTKTEDTNTAESSDGSGLNQEDVELVAERASVSREEAEEALREEDDIAEAISSLR